MYAFEDSAAAAIGDGGADNSFYLNVADDAWGFSDDSTGVLWSTDEEIDDNVWSDTATATETTDGNAVGGGMCDEKTDAACELDGPLLVGVMTWAQQPQHERDEGGKYSDKEESPDARNGRRGHYLKMEAFYFAKAL